MECVNEYRQIDYLDQWRQYQKHRTVEGRNEIVLNYIDLVKKIVFKFRSSYNNYSQLDDMINQGILALIDAVEKFDPLMGNKFETFATLKVRGAIIDFMRKQDWMPRNQRILTKEMDEVYGKLYSQNGIEPSKEQLSQEMGISEEHLEKLLHQKHNAFVLSYEEMIQEKLMVALPLEENEHSEDPEDQFLYKELHAELRDAIDQLNERERLVVSLYYFENLKLKEIAAVLNLTESRVSQIHSASILKMKYQICKE